MSESKEAVTASLRCVERISVLLDQLDLALPDTSVDDPSVKSACEELTQLMGTLESLRKFITPDDAAWLAHEIGQIRQGLILN